MAARRRLLPAPPRRRRRPPPPSRRVPAARLGGAARAVQLVNEGENVFLTGGAGNVVVHLRTIIELLALHVRQSAGLDPIPSAPLRPLRA